MCPGCIDRKLSDGPHQLIRDGARLITGAKDIITDLAADYPELMVDVMLGDEARERITNRQAENLPPEQKAVLSALKMTFRPILMKYAILPALRRLWQINAFDA